MYFHQVLSCLGCYYPLMVFNHPIPIIYSLFSFLARSLFLVPHRSHLSILAWPHFCYFFQFQGATSYSTPRLSSASCLIFWLTFPWQPWILWQGLTTHWGLSLTPCLFKTETSYRKMVLLSSLAIHYAIFQSDRENFNQCFLLQCQKMTRTQFCSSGIVLSVNDDRIKKKELLIRFHFFAEGLKGQFF